MLTKVYRLCHQSIGLRFHSESMTVVFHEELMLPNHFPDSHILNIDLYLNIIEDIKYQLGNLLI